MEMTHKPGTVETASHPIDYGAWALVGMTAGFIAGITFAVFEAIVAAIVAGNFFGPFRMIAAVALGPAALTPDVSLATAILTGTLVHLVYSIVAGAVFALIIAAISPLHSSGRAIVLTATALGLLMWLVNFYLIAPAAGWTWFSEGANQFWQGFVAHTFLYGTVAGWYIAARRKGTRDRRAAR